MLDPFKDLTSALHGAQIAVEFGEELCDKNLRGAAEHGGKLWENPIGHITAFAIEEVIDQAVYLKTLQTQLTWLRELIKSLIDDLADLEEPLSPDNQVVITKIKELLDL
jgi:hypothetical protein